MRFVPYRILLGLTASYRDFCNGGIAVQFDAAAVLGKASIARRFSDSTLAGMTTQVLGCNI